MCLGCYTLSGVPARTLDPKGVDGGFGLLYTEWCASEDAGPKGSGL